MTNIEAKNYIKAAIDSLQKIMIMATRDNVTNMDGSLYVLTEVLNAMDSIEVVQQP